MNIVFIRSGTSTRKKPGRPAFIGEYDIELKGRKVRFSLKRSYRARLVWLKIGTENGFCVTVPRDYNTKNLAGYLEQRADWIVHNLDKYCSVRPQPYPEKDIPYKISYLGKYYVLKKNSQEAGFTAVSQDNGDLSFNICAAFGGSDKQGLKTWLQEQARNIISEKVKAYSHKLQVIYNKIYIREQKTIWGSCSTAKNLSFNWRLIMVPEYIIDYVIIHELCHLKEMNHSKAFWKLVAALCPDWRLHRKWLNEHSCELKALLSDNNI